MKIENLLLRRKYSVNQEDSYELDIGTFDKAVLSSKDIDELLLNIFEKKLIRLTIQSHLIKIQLEHYFI